MQRMLLRFLVPSLALALVAAGCSSEEEEEFEFGADEMRAVATGDWSGELQLDGQEATPLTMRLTYEAPGQKPLCGERTLGVAPLCTTTSSIALTGLFTTENGAYRDAPVSGGFHVDGTRFQGGSLDLSLEDGSTFEIYLTKDGAATDGRVSVPMMVAENSVMRPAGTISLWR